MVVDSALYLIAQLQQPVSQPVVSGHTAFDKTVFNERRQDAESG